MKLIDKDALVAEIEKRRNDYINSLMTEQVYTLNDILDFIDTLKVKEVDLEKEEFIKKELGYIKGYREMAIKKLEERKTQSQDDNNEPKDNWELIKEFVNKFGRIPKDEDELNILVEYVLKRQKPADIIPQDFEKYVEHLLSLSDGEGHGSPAKLKEVCSELLRLAKLQQKSTWSEEDEKMKDAIYSCVDSHYDGLAKTSLLIWLKSIKDRTLPQPKQEWSEEDERTYKSITYSFAHNYPLTVQQQEFVKSIKDRYTWKPSDKQLNNLLDVLSFDNCTLKRRELLKSLYNDLKKLREE